MVWYECIVISWHLDFKYIIKNYAVKFTESEKKDIIDFKL